MVKSVPEESFLDVGELQFCVERAWAMKLQFQRMWWYSWYLVLHIFF